MSAPVATLDAALVLLVHQGAVPDLPGCAASLQRQTLTLPQPRLLIVQNGAEAAVAAAVRRALPGARTLALPRNAGWAGGNNAGIRVALAEGAQAVVLLNVDTVLAPDWLAALLCAAAQRPAAHILQSKILLQGTDRLNSVGNRIHYLGYGFCSGHGRRDGWPVPEAMNFASGAAMLIKREVFERIGLFREDYFLYGEDLEFCWRAQLAGFNLGLVEESVCHHRYRFRRQPELILARERNRWTTMLTLPRRRTLLVLAPCLLVSQLLLCAYGVAVGWGGGVWRLLRHFSRPATWRQLRRVRRQNRQLRVRSDAEILRSFAGTIEFPDFGGRVLRRVCNPCLQAYWWLARRLIVW